jgi:hypothetical protein
LLEVCTHRSTIDPCVQWNYSILHMFHQEFIMDPITKLRRKTKQFMWTWECHATWELIKHNYVKANILISPNWDVEFHVYIDASFLVEGAMSTKNLTWKHDQPIVYASKLLNSVGRNYNTTKHEALAMVFAPHKFRHYLLSNKFIFYVDHMGLVYLVNKPRFHDILLDIYYYFWNMSLL